MTLLPLTSPTTPLPVLELVLLLCPLPWSLDHLPACPPDLYPGDHLRPFFCSHGSPLLTAFYCLFSLYISHPCHFSAGHPPHLSAGPSVILNPFQSTPPSRVLPDWSYSLPWTWGMAHLLQKEAFCTVLNSSITHLLLAPLHCIYSSGKSFPPSFTPVSWPSCLCAPGWKAFSPLLHLTCMPPSNPSEVSLFSEPSPSPQADLGPPSLHSLTPSLGTLYPVLSLWILLSASPTGPQASWEHWLLVYSVYSAPSINALLTINKSSWISEQIGLYAFFREDLWEKSINYGSDFFVVTKPIIY